MADNNQKHGFSMTMKTKTTKQHKMIRRLRTKLEPEKEKEFQSWYARWAEHTGIDKNPDSEEHKYDYRGAFASKQGPDKNGKWPSKFKDPDHPDRYVKDDDGATIDSISGERVDR